VPRRLAPGAAPTSCDSEVGTQTMRWLRQELLSGIGLNLMVALLAPDDGFDPAFCDFRCQPVTPPIRINTVDFSSNLEGVPFRCRITPAKHPQKVAQRFTRLYLA
jgi:hypothetical protein